MLKIIMFISIFSGLGLGFYSAKISKNEISVNTQSMCPKLPSKNEIFENETDKRCVTRFKGAGERFCYNKENVQQAMEDIFRRSIKAQKVREDEFNVYINQKVNDKKIRKYDPRLDLFARFQVKKFVMNNQLISQYSVSNKPQALFNIKTDMNEIICEQPKLSKLRNTDSLILFGEINRNKYALVTKDKKLNKFSSVSFSAFNELIQKKSWYLYFIQSHNKIENFLLANDCNKTIALAINHCVVKPEMDMQLEEIKWFPQNQEMGINTYCKRSGDQKWRFIDTKILRKI